MVVIPRTFWRPEAEIQQRTVAALGRIGINSDQVVVPGFRRVQHNKFHQAILSPKSPMAWFAGISSAGMIPYVSGVILSAREDANYIPRLLRKYHKPIAWPTHFANPEQAKNYVDTINQKTSDYVIEAHSNCTNATHCNTYNSERSTIIYKAEIDPENLQKAVTVASRSLKNMEEISPFKKGSSDL